MEPVALPSQWHTVELPHTPDRIEMTKEEDLTPAATELGAHVIPDRGPDNSRDTSADCREPSHQLGTATVDGRFVAGRRLETDQRFDGIEQPVLLGAAEGEQLVRKRHTGRFYNISVPPRCSAFLAVLVATSTMLLAQVPQPFPRPGQTNPQSRPPAAPPPPTTPDSQRPPTSKGEEPTEATLGVPIYPAAQFIASYDAGRGQRFYLFGVSAPYADMVLYYRTALKQRGDELFEAPPTHQFETARFREETMAFPPSVTIKDYTWGGSAGYPNPKTGEKPERFPTVIQIVPAPTVPEL